MENGFIPKFTEDCERIFGENLVSLLLIGSVKLRDTTPFSDTDIVAVIKTFDMAQMRSMRILLSQAERLIDISFLCQDELPEASKDFRLGTHGCYHLELVLKNATCLSGKNIFLEYDPPSNHDLRSSVFGKISEYAWWARRMYIESNRERSMESNYKLNSRLIKLLKDVLYLFGFDKINASAKETVECFIKMDDAAFSGKEKRTLIDMANPRLINKNVANLSEDYLETRFSIINKLYGCAARAIGQ